MRILSLETSLRRAEVALLDSDRVVLERELDAGSRSARDLLPLIKQMLSDTDWQKSDVDLVAVSCGPGSFTGLRVGLTIAKTWCFATEARLRGISTMRVVAAQQGVPDAGSATATQLEVPARLEVIVDAQRGGVYVQAFEYDSSWLPVGEIEVQPVEEWLGNLSLNTLVGGPAVERLQQQLPADQLVASAQSCEPHARTVGRLAWDDAQDETFDTHWELLPLYIRPSAAEEKRSSSS